MPTTHLAALFALLMAVVSVEGENKKEQNVLYNRSSGEARTWQLV